MLKGAVGLRFGIGTDSASAGALCPGVGRTVRGAPARPWSFPVCMPDVTVKCGLRLMGRPLPTNPSDEFMTWRLNIRFVFLCPEPNERSGRMESARLCGAGVLPFCIDKQGKVYFVLAKERYVPHWRGSSRWSAFEGGAKASERSVLTAAREFFEESIGTLTPSEGLREEVRDRLREGDFAMKVNILTDYNNRVQNGVVQTLHVTYVMKFPYDPSLPCAFHSLRNDLVTLQTLSETISGVLPSIPNVYPYFREDDTIVIHGKSYTVSAIEMVRMHREYLKVRVKIESKDGKCRGHSFTCSVAASQLTIAHNYEQWFDCMQKTTDIVRRVGQNVPPGCLAYKTTRAGCVKDVFVHPDFLEKSCVRLWSLDELVSMTNDRYFTSDVFRPYFVIVLRSVLKRFTTPPE